MQQLYDIRRYWRFTGHVPEIATCKSSKNFGNFEQDLMLFLFYLGICDGLQ